MDKESLAYMSIVLSLDLFSLSLRQLCVSVWN